MSGRVVVAVRVRPINARELSSNAKCNVQVEGDQITVSVPQTHTSGGHRGLAQTPKVFTFDRAYDSMNYNATSYAGQDHLYQDLGIGLLDKTFAGYNCCIFAYGQTGSGKSYTMIGSDNKKDRGIIPSICEELFRRISEISDAQTTCVVEVSYLEIYSEKVRDLLSPSNGSYLRVREHPITGPYVEDLTKLVTADYHDIQQLIVEGNLRRTTASTNMNETSSRSHAVFTVTLTQRQFVADISTEKVSKVSLVDLAGSERVSTSGATGLRLKEGAEINRSLSALGRVISALADKKSSRRSGVGSAVVVPYRDSILTWLLKDSLGGNSLTTMIATISPAEINYEETLSTLRYADSAKCIQNHAVVNEDQNTKMIRELKAELELLRAKMASAEFSQVQPSLTDEFISIVTPDGEIQQISKAEIAARMEQNTKLMEHMNLTWEEKLAATKRVQEEREKALEDLGIDLGCINPIGLTTPRKIPHLINLSEDPLLAELLIYTLKPGVTRCGDLESASEIKLSAPSIRPEHCIFRNEGGIVTIEPRSAATVMVNGQRIERARRLKTSHRIILGDEALHIFRFNHPEEVRAEREASQRYPPHTPIHHSPHCTPMRSTANSADIEQSRSSLGTGSSPGSSPRRFEGLNLPRGERSETMPFYQRQDRILDPPEAYWLTKTVERLTTPKIPFALVPGDPDTDTSQIIKGNTDHLHSSSVESPKTSESPVRSIGSPISHWRRSRDNNSEHLIQILNAEQLVAEAKGTSQRSSLLSRLSAAQAEASKRLSDSHSFNALQAYEHELIRNVIQVWRTQSNIRLARTLCQSTPLLCQAQILARRLNPALTFQFVVLRVMFSISPLEEDDVYDHFDEDLARIKETDVAVRVMDRSRDLVYLWSLDKLKNRVSHLEGELSSSNQPDRRLSKDNTFLERPFPKYTLFGRAVLSLPLPARATLNQEMIVDIWSPYACVVVGLLRLEIELTCSPGSSVANIKLRIAKLSGISEKELTDIHIHTHFEKESDKYLTTSLASGFEDSPVVLNELHSCSLLIKNLPDILHFNVFGLAQSSQFLDRLESWDELQEAKMSDSAPCTDSSHPIITEIRISELDSAGIYQYCEAFSTGESSSGVFYLHQGLSRRVQVNLGHANGENHRIVMVSEMQISDVQSIDQKTGSRKRDEASPVNNLRILSRGTATAGDGLIQELEDVLGHWDSSVHNSIFLDRTTPADQVISILLKVKICDTHNEEFTIESELLLRMHGRDQQPGYISRLFSYDVLPAVVKIYPLPWLIQKVPDTTTSLLKVIRAQLSGHELLGDWQPRGLSLLEDHHRMKAKQARSLELQRTQFLYTSERLTTKDLPLSQDDELLQNVLQIWQRRTPSYSIADHMEAQALKLLLADHTEPSTTPIEFTDNVPITSTLYTSTGESDSEWQKSTFTLRPPYLLQYHASSQKQLKSILNVRGSSVRLLDNTETTRYQRYAFIVESPSFQQVYQATTEALRHAWCSAIQATK